MGDRRRSISLLPQWVREMPTDLSVTTLLLVSTNVAILFPVLNETILRPLLSVAFLLIVPGYVLIAALFPMADANAPASATDRSAAEQTQTAPLSLAGRALFSVGASIVIVSFVGVVLSATQFGIRVGLLLSVLSAISLLCTGIAVRRRWSLPPEERFSLPLHQWTASAYDVMLLPNSRREIALNIALAVTVVLSLSSVGFVLAFPTQEQQSTELYLLTENEVGELQAEDYPQRFTLGDSKQVITGVTNHEQTTVQYTLITQLERVEQRSSTTTVTERVELNRTRVRLESGEEWQSVYDVSPTITGERLRLSFLLYKGSPPSEPSLSTAYREVHLWIDVAE